MSFHNSDQVPVVPGFLQPIDTNKISRQLKLIDEGTKRGAEELPKQTSTIMDSVEQTVIQKVESEWAWQGDALIKLLRAYADRLLGFSVSARAAELRLKARNAQARLENASVQAGGALGPLKEAFIAARNELNAFQVKNRIKRPARNPTARWTTVGLLILLISVESVLNGTFFARASQYGLIGGIGTAIGISLVNIIFSFLLGLGPARLINYRFFPVRLLGLLATLLGFFALFTLHAFAVHYRDAMAEVPEARAFQVALQTLMREPWSIQSLASAYLFGLGVLFTIGSFWKGYRFDDPYPFYGAMWRRNEAARIAYSDEHQQFFDGLEEVREETIEELRAGITTIPLYPQKTAQILAQRNAQLGSFRIYETNVETACNQLLQIYRNANQQSRSTAAPVHFDQRWKLSYSFMDNPQVRELIVDPPSDEPTVKPVVEELRKDAEALLAQYSTLLHQYPNPSAIVEGFK
jgi:hypothetical protein